MNVFGAIDNLAWIWTSERGVVNPNGKELRRTQRVFDGPQAEVMLKSLTPAVLKEVQEAAGWFAALRNYRDGIAHQIPIYIPRLIDPKDALQWNELSKDIEKAFNERAFELAEELIDQQELTERFGSLMALCEGHEPIFLHPQMICDLSTVVNFGEKIFLEISS